MELRAEADIPAVESSGVDVSRAHARFGVWHADARVGELEVSPRDDGRCDVAVATLPVQSRAEARELVAAVGELIRQLGDGPFFVHVWDDLVRYEARQAGWSGALRAPLEPGAPTMPPASTPSSESSSDPPEDKAAALDAAIGAVNELLTSASVATRFGFGRRIQTLQVTTTDGRRQLRVRVPRRGDLMPEPLASAIDTTLAVKRRFGRDAEGVLGLSFDQGGANFASGAVIGQAEGATGTVFLSANLAFADVMEDARLQAAARGRRTSAEVPPPFTALEGVAAHELWHNLDAAIQVSGTYAEFNRQLGDALGVESLEQALRGGEPGAPPAWQAARTRLAREVSAYATTRPREATAEMFKLWWCSNGDVAPVVARFGELVDRFYPGPGV